MKIRLPGIHVLLAGLLACIATATHAQVPGILNYQGRIAVGTTNFDGTGQFKFALVDAAGTATYWSNDGTSTAGSQPTSAVLLTVTKGLYSVLLGDTTLANMTAISASQLNNKADVRLRVWFNDGMNGFQLLTPDQRLGASGYAIVAGGVNLPAPGRINQGADFALNSDPSRSHIAVGSNAGGTGSGNENTAVGYQSMLSASSGGGNTAVGALSLQQTTTGASNTAIGDYALNNNISGNDNTGVGVSALEWSTGSNNIAVGAYAGTAFTAGSNNIDIGHLGLAGDSGIIRIGTSGTHAHTYLAGVIHGDGSGLSVPVSSLVGSIASVQIAPGAVDSPQLASYLTLGGVTTGTFSGNLTGNVTGNVTGSAASFTGSLAGDVTGTQSATSIPAAVVTGKALTGFSSTTGTITAADSILSAINKLNGNVGLKANLASPTFTGTVTAPTFSGNVTGNVSGSAGSFTGSLAGDVTGTQGATVVAAVGSSTAAAVSAGTVLANAATSNNTAGTIVRRGGLGEFSAGEVIADRLSLPSTASSNAGVITQGGNRLIHSYGFANFFAGKDAGNFTMTGGTNTAVGNSALTANITGYQNVTLGGSALASNTYGDQNTACGYNALPNNTEGDRNTALGCNSLLANTSGSDNTSVGFESMYYSLAGTNNTGLGYHALFSSSDSSFNTAIGSDALESNYKGDFNSALGFEALNQSTTASRNVAIGTQALFTQSFTNGSSGGITWDSNNVAVGYRALYSNQPTATSNGIQNTALGTSALYSNTTGFNNTAVGHQALFTNTVGNRNTATGVLSMGAATADDNTAVGYTALRFSTGGANTAVGSGALNSNTTADNCVAVGYLALYSNTSGQDNVGVGGQTLKFNQTGRNNTAVGRDTMQTNTVGNYNTVLGSNADVAANNLTNATAIGNGAVVPTSNTIQLGNSSITSLRCQVGLTIVSDRAKKENFLPVDGAEVLRKIRACEVTSWNYIGHDPKQFRHYGPMAQDFYAAFGQDGIGKIGTDTTINSGDMAGVMFIAIKQLANDSLDHEQQIKQRDETIAALKKQVAELEAREEARVANERVREERLSRLETLMAALPKPRAKTVAQTKDNPPRN
ncbi:MAG: tail fiber domain-containing protein [Verrucomicrobiaceae bacterium]|nr:tail fiber domain-containing protein [Verrucomicrobiaceae bacterium]